MRTCFVQSTCCASLALQRKARRAVLVCSVHAIACRFGSAQSIPQVCRSLQKAAYDPRVCGILLKISPLSVRAER